MKDLRNVQMMFWNVFNLPAVASGHAAVNPHTALLRGTGACFMVVCGVCAAADRWQMTDSQHLEPDAGEI